MIKGLGPEWNHEGDQKIKEESFEKYQGKNKKSKDDQIRWIKFNVKTRPFVSVPRIVVA